MAANAVDSANRQDVERGLAALSGADSQWRHLALGSWPQRRCAAAMRRRPRGLYTRISGDQTALPARARARRMIPALGGPAPADDPCG